jgi:hypothetical protein
MPPGLLMPPWDPRLRLTNPQSLQPMAMPTPPQAPQRPGLLQRLAGNLFPGGQMGGLLDPEQLQGLQRQGLMQLGIGLMSNSGQRVVGTPGAGVGERIGQAFQSVNWPQMVQGAAQQSVQVQGLAQQRGREQALAKLGQKYAPKAGETAEQRFERISAMTSELAAMPGMEDVVGKLSNVLAQLRPDDRRNRPFRIEAGTGPNGKVELYRIGESGSPEPLGIGQAPSTGGVPQLRTVQGPGGVSMYEEWNPRTGKWTATGKRAFSAPSEQERRAAFFLPFLPEAETAIANFTGAPDRFSTLWQDKGFREITSAERQELSNAGTVYAEAWLRLTTGAAYNQQEFDNAYKLFTPQPGDKPATLKAKARRRAELLATLQGQAGRMDAPPGTTPAPATPNTRPPLNFKP